jgi:hypothetical protein
MQELENLMKKLNSDVYSALSVFDKSANRFLFRNKSHSEIIQEFGTAEDFFEDLFAKGHRNLTLTLKRKNGSTYKIDGQSFDVNFSASNEPQTLPVQQTQPQPQQKQDVFSNSFGLGTLDVMNLMVAKNDASRLFTENEVLKGENKELKSKYETIREEQLLSKYNADKESGLWGAIQGVITNAPALISTFKTGASVGLAAPVETFASETKQHFATTLQHIDDSVVNVLDSINNGLNSNQEFSSELAELLKKYQLWEA